MVPDVGRETRPDWIFLAMTYPGQTPADNDQESKSTILLLQWFRPQAGAAKSVGPTLTIADR